ncbi:LacI family DNA-binding transcriptional regulator [Cellulomonas sp. P5_E12]
MRATVKDVAARAGVSPKTVSNVINGVVFVRPETRERVERALAELDYVPNLGARGLRNGRYGLIALALPDLSTAYSAELAHHFVEEGHARGWSVQIEETAAEPERERELLSRARSHLVEGLVLNPVSLEVSAVSVLAGPLPPTVLIGEVVQDRADHVGVDSVRAAQDMTEHLLASGRRRIAVVGSPGPIETAAARQRTEGYRLALAAAEVAADPSLEISTATWTTDEAVVATRAFLAEHDIPDAFFAFTDSMAFGVLSVLWERGLQVPRDVAVAGFDDIVGSRYAVPPLTTVAFDLRAYATTALDLLGDRIDDPGRAARQLVIPHRLVVRASTG